MHILIARVGLLLPDLTAFIQVERGIRQLQPPTADAEMGPGAGAAQVRP